MAPVLKVFPFWQHNRAYSRLAALLAQAHIPFYLVGGSVREAILHEKGALQGPFTQDIDLTTPLGPDVVLEKLRKGPIKLLTKAKTFGTIRLVLEDTAFDLTSFRQDICTDGRHAQVRYTDDMLLDAQRRDFTCNALYATPDGLVFDPLGGGLTDLLRHKIRFIGAPLLRLKEDHLRLLRLFRFQARLGRRPLPKKYLHLAKSKAHTLALLSTERRYQELIKILQGPRALRVLAQIQKLGFFPHLFHMSWPTVPLFPFFDAGLARRLPLMALWAFGAQADEMPLTRAAFKKFALYAKWGQHIKNHKSKKALFELRGAMSYHESCGLLALFGAYPSKIASAKGQLLRQGAPAFPLSADDIMAAFSLPPGPQVSIWLESAKKAWIESLGTLSKEDCLGAIKLQKSKN